MINYRTISITAAVLIVGAAVVFIGSVLKTEHPALQTAAQAAPVSSEAIVQPQVDPVTVELDNFLSFARGQAAPQTSDFALAAQTEITPEPVLYTDTQSVPESDDAWPQAAGTSSASPASGNWDSSFASSSSGSSGSSSGDSSLSSTAGGLSGGSVGASGGSSTGGSSGGSSGSAPQAPAPGSGGGSGGTPVSEPADTDRSGSGGAIDVFRDISVTVLSSVERLLRDDISAPGTSSAQIFCAKNETEAFQVIVTNKSSNSLPDIEMHVSDWQGPAGTKKPKITLFREHYVKTMAPSRGVPSNTPVGWYPSALIPFEDPYRNTPITTGIYQANHAPVAGRENQGYWVDVRVDSDVPAGTYTCSMLVTSSDRKVVEIPVTLTVWDFELPAVRQWTTWILQFENLGKLYGLYQDNGAYYELVRSRHWDIMYEHGIYPTFVEYPSIDQQGNVNFYSYEKKLKAFVAKYGPGVLRIPFYAIRDGFDQNGNNPVGAKILSDYHEFSLAHPEYGQFFYIIDEPYTIEQINKVVNIANLIDTYAPSIKLLTNGDVYVDYYKDLYLGSGYHPGGNPAYADYVNKANAVEAASDIRSFYSRYRMNPYTTQQSLEVAMQSALNSGKIVWICQMSRLDQQFLMFRMASWRGYVLGATGQFEWRMMSSDHQLDPWVNPVNQGTGGAYIWNGYDQYIYCGTPSRVGFSGPGGPIASMGLKVFRDSVEDYAYFKLAESLTNRQAVLNIVAPVTPDFKTAGSLEAYESARQKIAQLILNNQ